MRHLAAIIGLFCMGFTSLSANDTFSKSRLNDFSDKFTCEQKNELNKGGLTSPCTDTDTGSNGAGPFVPPPNPPAPPLMANHLPIVIVNNSGLHDSEVFIVMTVGSTQFIEFNATTGVGALQTAVAGQSPTLYNINLTELPTGSTGRVLYLEQDATVDLNSANLWFSLREGLNINVNAGPAIAQPSAVPSAGNLDSYTPFDFFEITINSQASPAAAVFCDLTAVTDFSIPLYGFMSTPVPSTPSNLGFFQPQQYIFSQVATAFANAPESTEWNKLVIKNPSPPNDTVRILSTQLSISRSPASASPDSFSFEYLTSPSGFNYISDVLDYYSTNLLTITTPPLTGPVIPSITYTGNTVPATETIMVTSTPPGNGSMTIDLSGTSITFDLFASNGPSITPVGLPDPRVEDEFNKIFTQSIIVGLIPTTMDLNKPFLNQESTHETFYKYNSNLSTSDQTGPWYDLYSKALHQLADVYTSGYDDEIYSSVQLQSQTIETSGPTPTYVGITIGNVTDQY